MARKPQRHRDGRRGRVVETRGRRVLVRDDDGERVCFLAGHRAVVGDRVTWIPVRGEGGKIIDVDDRETVLRRIDARGREQILAANLGGVAIVAAASAPPFGPRLVDRYRVAAARDDLDVFLCLNKIDLGVPDDVEAELALRVETGLTVVRCSAHTGEGVDDLRAVLRDDGPWALVGHSGVGKTSLVRALLPDIDVGPVGELSEYWGTGRHTTTQTTLFGLPGGGELVDSPGIRSFTPGGLSPTDMRDHFPGVGRLGCHYRDCLHRPDEDGCVAEDEVPGPVLSSYRGLLSELVQVAEAQRGY